MNPTPEEMERILMEAWIRTPLRAELAEILVAAIIAGEIPKSVKDNVRDQIVPWAVAFLLRPGWSCTPGNIEILQEVSMPELLAYAKDISKGMS